MMTKKKRQKLAPNGRAQGRKTIESESCADHETASSAAVITDWFEVMILVQQRPLQFLYDRLLQMLNGWCHLRTAIGRIQWRSGEVRLLSIIGYPLYTAKAILNIFRLIMPTGQKKYFRNSQKLCSFKYSLLSLLTMKIFHGWFYLLIWSTVGGERLWWKFS